MNRIVVEAGIGRLTAEISQRHEQVSNLTEELGGLTSEYESLCERLDVHGEDVQGDIDRTSAQMADCRREIGDHEQVLAEMQKRLNVTQQALLAVENSENLQSYMDLSAHADMVSRRYHLAVNELYDAYTAIVAYRRDQSTLSRKVNDFARENNQPLPTLPPPINFEVFKDGYLGVPADYVRKKFPIDQGVDE